MTQAHHEEWNAGHHPGTRQLCDQCGNATGRCEEDTLRATDDGPPLCEECYADACEAQEADADRSQSEHHWDAPTDFNED